MKLKNAKLYSRKSLSIFLAVVMLLMTCSVAFATIASARTSVASASEAAVAALAAAIDSDEYVGIVQALYDTSDTSVKYTMTGGVKAGSSSDTTTATNTVTIASYEDYVKFVKLCELVMDAAHEAVLYDGGSSRTYGYSGSASVTGTVSPSRYLYGDNMESINGEVISRLGEYTYSSTLTTEQYTNLINVVFYGWSEYSNVSGLAHTYNESSSNDTSNTSMQSTYGTSLTFYLDIVTTDVAGWLENNDATDYSSMTLQTSYSVVVSFVSASKSIMWTTYYSYGYRFTSASNAKITADPTTSATSVGTNVITLANTLKTAGDAAIAAYPNFDAVVDVFLSETAGDTTALTAYYDAYNSAYTALELALGDNDSDTSDEEALIASMFASYSSYDTFVDNYDTAKDFAIYAEYAATLEELEATNSGYGTFDALAFGDNKDQILADYQVYSATYSLFTNEEVFDYFFDSEDYELTVEYYEVFTENVNAYYAQEYKDTLDYYVDFYGDIDEIDMENMSSAEKSVAYTAFNSNLTAALKYSDQVVNAIFTDEEIETYYEYKSLFQTYTNSAVEFFTTYSGDISNVDTDELLDIFPSTYSTQYAALTSLYNTIASTTSDEYADSLLNATFAKADALYSYVFTELASRFKIQVEYAYDVYLTVANADGSIDSFDVQLYWDLKSSIGTIETGIYDQLKEDGNLDTYLLETTQTEYEALLANVIPLYESYASGYGFSNYETVDYEYADREVYTTDVLKDEAYTVTDETLTDVVDTLDSLLTDPDVLAVVAELLGVDTATSLYDLLIPIIEDMLFTDDIINMVVELLYPLIQGEFDTVWSTLPAEVEFSGYDLSVTYNKSLNDILLYGYENTSTSSPTFSGTQTMVGIYPSALAVVLVKECGYSSTDDIIVALTNASQNWSSAFICTDGSLDLDWGVDEACAEIDAKIEAGTYDAAVDGTKFDIFCTTMGNALQGLYPILAALLLNQTWNFWSEDMANAAGTIVIAVDVTVDLNLGATANNGYINALGPIFEILGYYDYTDAAGVLKISTGAEMVEMLFTDVYAAVKQLLESPVENILSAIPEAIYGLVFDMIPYLLSQLQTTIYYNAYADLTDVGTVISWFLDLLNIADSYTQALDDIVPINVGEMFDLSTMGIDTTLGLSGLLKSVGLDIYGLDLDEGLIASLGTMVTVESNRTVSACGSASGYAKTVEADTNAVLYYLLETVLNSIKTGGFYEILEVFMDEEAVLEISDMISGFLSPTMSATDMIAAICELFSPVKYAEAEYFILEAFLSNDDTIYIYYYETEDTYYELTAEQLKDNDLTEDDCYAVVGEGEIWNEETLAVEGKYDYLYSDYWTSDQAEFITDDLVEYVTSICTLLGIDIEETLSGLISDLLSDVFTTSTLDSILDLIDGFVGDLLTDETISMIIDIVSDLGIIDDVDIDAIIGRIDGSYTYESFEGSDRTAFMAVIADFLDPLVPVLKFFLLSDEDITIYDESITLYSYNGYESAIIPLFEALGCDSADIATYAELAELDGTDFINAVIEPIMGLLDRVESGDLFTTLLEILPNILYFVQVGALNDALDNLLQPVFAVLDTIRPIYDLTFSINIDVLDLVDGMLGDLGLEEYINISVVELMNLFIESGETVEKESVATDADGNTYVYNYFIVSEENYPHVISILLGYVSTSVTVLENEYIQQAIQVVASLAVLVDEETYPELYAFLTGLGEVETEDQILFLLYYIVYGTEEGVAGFDALVDGLLDYTGLDEEGQEQVLALAAGLINAIATFSPEDVQTEIATAVTSVYNSLSESFTAIGSNLNDMFSGLQDAADGYITSASESFSTAFSTALATAESTYSSILENLSNLGDNLQDAVDDVVDNVTDAATTSTNAFVAFFQELFAKIKAFFDSLFSF